MAEYTIQHTTAEWLERLDGADVPCAPILRRGEIIHNEQVVARGIIAEFDQPSVGRVRQPKPAARFELHEAVIAGRAREWASIRKRGCGSSDTAQRHRDNGRQSRRAHCRLTKGTVPEKKHDATSQGRPAGRRRRRDRPAGTQPVPSPRLSPLYPSAHAPKPQP